MKKIIFSFLVLSCMLCIASCKDDSKVVIKKIESDFLNYNVKLSSVSGVLNFNIVDKGWTLKQVFKNHSLYEQVYVFRDNLLIYYNTDEKCIYQENLNTGVSQRIVKDVLSLKDISLSDNKKMLMITTIDSIKILDITTLENLIDLTGERYTSAIFGETEGEFYYSSNGQIFRSFYNKDAMSSQFISKGEKILNSSEKNLIYSEKKDGCINLYQIHVENVQKNLIYSFKDSDVFTYSVTPDDKYVIILQLGKRMLLPPRYSCMIYDIESQIDHDFLLRKGSWLPSWSSKFLWN